MTSASIEKKFSRILVSNFHSTAEKNTEENTEKNTEKSLENKWKGWRNAVKSTGSSIYLNYEKKRMNSCMITVSKN